MSRESLLKRAAGGLLAAAVSCAAQAQVATFSEDFTGASTSNSWFFQKGACLTAGTATSTAQPGPVPSCGTIWTSYYSQQTPGQASNGVAADAKLVGGSAGTVLGGATTTALDPLGSGALRLTNGYPYGYYEAGSIVSSSTFDASQGVQITFKTVSYRGNSGGAGTDGADGIGFQLMDGSLSTSAATYNGIGSVGGSLGYTCSNDNPPYDGLVGAYLGLGIDEYGNFLNGNALEPGYSGNAVGGTYGDNTAVGYGYLPNRIGLRGAGNVSWNYLNATYPSYYPTSTLTTTALQQQAVRNTCITGRVLDYSSTTKNYSNCAVGVTNGSSSAASFTGTVTSGSSTVTVSAVASGTLLIGQTVTGSGIPGSTTIAAIVVGSPAGTYTLRLTNSATASHTNETLSAANNSACPALVSNPSPVLMDYAPITAGYAELLSSVKLANEGAMARPTGLTTLGITNGNVFTYQLKITQNELLSLSYSLNGGSYTPVITNQSILAANGPLPPTLRFGFAGSTGGSTNIHELLCFKAAPIDTASTSATTDQQLTSKVQTNAQAYFAYYDPNDWTGRMTAYGLNVNSTTGALSINALANWDSECVLTGVTNLAAGTCQTTGVAAPASGQPVTPGSSGSRVMLTWDGIGSGVAFEYPGATTVSSNITAAEVATLDFGDSSNTALRLNYLRGDRSNEITTSGSGIYRTRGGVLSDIIDSSPSWMGAPASPYSLAFRDRLYPAATPPENGGSSYASFISSNQSRINVVYVGANDGFLHGFRSGTENAAGQLSANLGTASANDGAEIIAYMPSVALNTIHNSSNGAVDFSNPQYSHAFFVDSTPGTGDLYYGGSWHTWLAGGLGAGGADFYALDVTDPSTTSFNENNAANVVLGDWTPATIACANVLLCNLNLGSTYGTPLIRRLHNGNWGVIFGNGFGSSSGDAGIFIMTVDQSTAAKTFYYLSTGTAGTNNGIAYVTAADLDGDHITDYVYGGDLNGHIWRFDLTSCAAMLPAGGSCAATTAWGVTPGPLFTTQSGQPITTPVVLASAQVTGKTPVLIVSFGTGRRTQFTNASSTTYVGSTQSLYGVWDWNLSNWNAKSATQYASLSAAQMAVAVPGAASPGYTLSYSNLQPQTFSAGSNSGSVDSSNNAITWEQCGTGTTILCNTGSFGWYANLTSSAGAGSYEQIVSSPTLFQQGLLVNSTIPAVNNPLSCATSKDLGNTYIINVVTGGTFTTTGTTPTTVSGFLTNSDVNTVGQNTNETGALTVVQTGAGKNTLDFAIGQSSNPTPGAPPGNATQFQLPNNIQVNRVTWTQLR